MPRQIDFANLSMVLSHVYSHNRRDNISFGGGEHELIVANYDEIVGVPVWCTLTTPGSWTLETRDWIVGFGFYADHALDEPHEREGVYGVAKFSQSWGETNHRWFNGDFEAFRRDMTAFKLALPAQADVPRVFLDFEDRSSGGPDQTRHRADAAVA